MNTATSTLTAPTTCPDWCQTGPNCWTVHGQGREALHRHDFDGLATLEQFVDHDDADGTVTEWTVTVDVPTPWGTTMAVQLNADDATRLAHLLTSAASLASEVDQ